MDVKDALLLPVSVLVILTTGFIARHLIYRNNEPYARYFMGGLLLKVTGTILFCAIYRFYYEGGDTTTYFEQSSFLYHQFFEKPGLIWEIWKAKTGTVTLQTADIIERMPYYRNESTYMVIRIATLIGLLTGNSFWVTSVFFAAISFTGAWAMYRVFVDWYPSLYRPFAIAVLALPSVIFWGSGLMKDTIALGSLGWLLYALHQIFIRKSNFVMSALLIIVSMYLIVTLKAYILFGFAPAVIIWVISKNYGLVKEAKLRGFIVIMTLVFIGNYIYWKGDSLQSIFNVLFAKFVKMSMGFQSWHGFLTEQRGQSGYSLGEMEFTPWGILKKFPASINVTLFRPYLSEAKNPVAMITALESTILMLFTLFVFIKTGFLRTFRIIFSNPEIAMCFVFVMLFGFAVGFSSYNFGALARYKIPCLPFYVAMLFMILYQGKEKSLSKLRLS
ncbi:MAG: hypothetical protein IPM47_07810 [Sphingobacteriales bacterium]|nr:MAG: hypothetical protein IPM47_07810 [Sphingobacteriales bacterium]